MNDQIIWATGVGQRVDAFPDRLGAAYEYAEKSQTHMWVATLAHRLGNTALDAIDGAAGEPLNLDAESLLMMPAIGCYVCEQNYEPRLRRRKCPGEPS